MPEIVFVLVLEFVFVFILYSGGYQHDFHQCGAKKARKSLLKLYFIFFHANNTVILYFYLYLGADKSCLGGVRGGGSIYLVLCITIISIVNFIPFKNTIKVTFHDAIWLYLKI